MYQPTETWLVVWNLCSMVILMTFAMCAPIELGFGIDLKQDYFSIFVLYEFITVWYLPEQLVRFVASRCGHCPLGATPAASRLLYSIAHFLFQLWQARILMKQKGLGRYGSVLSYSVRLLLCLCCLARYRDCVTLYFSEGGTKHIFQSPSSYFVSFIRFRFLI